MSNSLKNQIKYFFLNLYINREPVMVYIYNSRNTTDQTVYSLTSILHYDSNTFFFTDYKNISLDHKYKLFVMTNWFKGPSAVIVW